MADRVAVAVITLGRGPRGRLVVPLLRGILLLRGVLLLRRVLLLGRILPVALLLRRRVLAVAVLLRRRVLAVALVRRRILAVTTTAILRGRGRRLMVPRPSVALAGVSVRHVAGHENAAPGMDTAQIREWRK
jgi:hypothetical protein